MELKKWLAEHSDQFRQWALQDQALRGLGGAPNNWRRSPEFGTRQHGMSTGHAWWSIAFDNDAFDLHIWTRYTDENKAQIAMMIAAEDFRKLALWYLWRWAWGEWFGLRRWLFYRDVRRRLGQNQGYGG